MSHSIKAISSHQCSFIDEARRDIRLDTFQMTASTVITNKTLKQNPIYVSLIMRLTVSTHLSIHPSYTSVLTVPIHLSIHPNDS